MPRVAAGMDGPTVMPAAMEQQMLLHGEVGANSMTTHNSRAFSPSCTGTGWWHSADPSPPVPSSWPCPNSPISALSPDGPDAPLSSPVEKSGAAQKYATTLTNRQRGNELSSIPANLDSEYPGTVGLGTVRVGSPGPGTPGLGLPWPGNVRNVRLGMPEPRTLELRNALHLDRDLSLQAHVHSS